MEEKLSWAEYCKRFPQPYDLSVVFGKPLSEYPANYDEMRKANLKWHAVYWHNHADYIGPEAMLNPFVAGGWYYGMNGSKEYIPDPRPPRPQYTDSEIAAGISIGPAGHNVGGRAPAGTVTQVAPVSRKKSWLARLFGR